MTQRGWRGQRGEGEWGGDEEGTRGRGVRQDAGGGGNGGGEAVGEGEGGR